jgi:uncharacterized protein (TIGR03083 family)
VTTREFDSYCDRITTVVAALNREPVADLGLGVPTCPGWSIADLIQHTGTVHRWTERIVATGATERPRFGVVSPDDASEYADWLAVGADQLTATLRAAGPDAACWAWGADQHARWWARRMVFETLLHHADLVLASGREPVLDPGESADGIDELLANLPYGRRTRVSMAELPTGGETVHLHATDSDGEWMIRLHPGGMTWERGHGKGDVALRGPAADLLLFAYGRYSPDHPRFQVFGDRDLLTQWQSKTAL